ncbi:LL-diaminopimelate aminotransferase [Anoxybacillus sp. P3H1B]|uniref:pyridoxal phosphate-dependent aminotransferase n=1 Tax=unclassified Anoxybacillus TaxID=2639704 RepID=UPI0007942609|nr:MULTISPECIES: pyridoxal phosphate-dependent aminotransferase [unclassified Anoxybacillus]KXG10304.1 LL-diaminopimelate aminotransferase [Anoxybacillus sp. P3H1B]OQM44205.1 LL-diaminopimelate aminotransferase [Anoxybacillus sp. UARK-01]
MKSFVQSELLQSLPKQFFASLVDKVGKVVAQGHDVINLGQGNPDQPTPPHIVEALQKAAANPKYHKYSPFRGYSFLKEAVAAFYQREYGVTVDPEREVAVLFGGKAGLVEIPQCLLNPGDVVLVPDPGYPDYWSGVALARAKMEMMPLYSENGFLPDYRQLDEKVVEKAKLMFLNYPNNPTGAVATDSFFQETVSFAQKHGICVVHDFAYGAIGFDGQKPISFLQAEGAKDVGIEIYTFSKTYNMAGWRVGFAIGNESVIAAINLLQDHLYVSLFGAIQEAAAVALLESQQCVTELVALYESRRNAFIGALQEIGWNVSAPAGSFFAWLPVPKGWTSERFADLLLEQAHVVVAPGIGFGEHGEGYVRVGLLTSEERLTEAARRIAKLNLFQQAVKK